MASKSFFVTGGTVQSQKGAIYLHRSADDQLLSLCRTETFAYVLTARQMGKSSLMVNTAEQLAAEGIRTAEIDLNGIGVKVTKEEWYLGILFEVRAQLGLRQDVIAWWHAPERHGLSTAQRLLLFFEQVVLAEISGSVIIFVDEIETTLRLDFTDDFFAAVRSIHNARSGRRFERLAFVLIGVATPDSLIRDRQLTPFNVGQGVVLSDFTYDEALPLADGFELPRKDAQHILRRVLHWTGGHPYLTQRLCRAIVEARKDEWTDVEIDLVVSRLFFGDQSDEDSNLRFVRQMLLTSELDREELLKTYREILRESPPVLDEEQSLIKSHLKLSGVVKRQGGTLRVRNPIYREVFDESWVKDNTPVNWTRRLTRVAAAVFLALMFVSAGLTPYAWKQKVEADAQRVKADKAREQAEEALRNEQSLRQQLQQAINGLTEANKQLEAAKGRADKLTRQAQIAARQEKAAKEVAETKSELAAEETVRRTQAQRSSFTSKLIATDQILRRPDSLPERVLVARESLLQAREAEEQTAETQTTDPLPLLAYQNLMESAMRLPRAQTIPLAEGQVSNVMFMKDGQNLMVFDSDKHTLQIWDSKRKRLSARDMAGLKNIKQIRDDGKYVAMKGADKSLIIREVESGREFVVNGACPESADEEEITVRLVMDVPTVTEEEEPKITVEEEITVTAVEPVCPPAGACRPARVICRPAKVIFSPKDDYALILVRHDTGTTLELWRISDGDKLADTTMQPGLLRADFSADGRFIFAIDKNGDVRVFETRTGRAVSNNVASNAPAKATKQAENEPPRESGQGAEEGRLMEAVFSENRKFLVAANGEVAEVWNLSDPQAITKITLRATRTDRLWTDENGLAISNDGQILAVIGEPASTITLWDVPFGATFRTIDTSDAINLSFFSPDVKNLITVASNSFRVWDLKTGTEVYRAVDKEDDEDSGDDPAPNNFKRVLLSRDGNSLVTVRKDGLTRIWDLTADEDSLWKLISPFGSNSAMSNDRQYAVTVDQHRSPCSDQCSPDGPVTESTVQVWDMRTGRLADTMKFEARVHRTAFNDDGKEIVVMTGDGRTHSNTIWLWQRGAKEARELATFTASEPVNISLSYNGKYLAVLINDKDPSILLWNADQPGGVERRPWRLGVREGRKISFVPHKDHLAVINDEGAQLWDVLSNRPVGNMIGRGLDNRQPPLSLYVFSYDGTYVAGFSKKTRNVEVAETATGTIVARLPHPKGVKALAISRDGSLIVTAGDEDGMMRVWAWKEQGAAISQAQYAADSVSFNPGGEYVASTALNDSVRVWDIARAGTISEVARIQTAKGASTAVFSPDTKYLYTVDSSMLQAWQWQVDQLICATDRLTKKHLSMKEWEKKINVLPSEKQFLRRSELSCGITSTMTQP